MSNRIKNQVNLFKSFSVELAEPDKKSFVLIRVTNPSLLGVRMTIIKVKKMLKLNQITVMKFIIN